MTRPIRVTDMNKVLIRAGFCWSGEDWTSPYPMRAVLVQDVVREIANYLKWQEYEVVEDYWDESDWIRTYKTEEEMLREHKANIKTDE